AAWQSNPLSGKTNMEDGTQKAQAFPYGAGRSSVVQTVLLNSLLKLFPCRGMTREVSCCSIHCRFPIRGLLPGCSEKRYVKDKVPEI
ncbi:MAG TPA: hypothetical protein PK198_01385, partial [Saprospiraceae bacterium]|nr:hypothetical protein [Saprospiraceae bacterium]